MTPVLLLILDGWGYREETKYNAIAEAHPEHFTSLWQNYPHTLIPASGESVGLPEGNIGTSEVGHMNIGSGTIILTDMLRINKAIHDNTLKENGILQQLFNHAITNNASLHLIGMLSPGGVHSHQDHLFALLREAKNAGVPHVVIHVITDGRDKPPKSALEYLKALEEVIAEVGNATIATVSGRYYAMDRDTNWDRIEKAENAIFEGEGNRYHTGEAAKVIEDQYQKGTTDEFLVPSILLDESGKPKTIHEHDAVLFFNFRPDRARELTQRIINRIKEKDILFVTMTEYDKSFAVPVLFPPEEINVTISDAVSLAGLKQVHIAETEKYAHVTYFLNGGREEKHPNEEFILIDSRKDVPTHDKAPEMKAKEIAAMTVQKIDEGFDFLAINLANADMVGHSGIMEATVEAIRAEDEAIGRMIQAILDKNGVAVITADHGNAELMFNEETGQPYTAHTLSPVPVIITKKNLHLRDNGSMADIAPTVLKLLALEKPEAMTGESLF